MLADDSGHAHLAVALLAVKRCSVQGKLRHGEFLLAIGAPLHYAASIAKFVRTVKRDLPVAFPLPASIRPHPLPAK
jgi:hypothetical protein